MIGAGPSTSMTIHSNVFVVGPIFITTRPPPLQTVWRYFLGASFVPSCHQAHFAVEGSAIVVSAWADLGAGRAASGTPSTD